MNPFNYLSGRPSFSKVRDHTWNLFLSSAHGVPAAEWQGLGARPEFATWELMNYTFTQPLIFGEDLELWRQDIQPNLPWADDHFEERVCGAPINPGVEWANWPWGTSADKFRDENGMFNHNYMERYWSRRAGVVETPTKSAEEWYIEAQGHPQGGNFGIRNNYGDLNDLVGQLVKNPLSRQEWFPIFHPEDVGEVIGGRKPCSLGYQFWVRGGKLHVYYPLRSCDFFHHMQDDIYLTLRLLLWVLNECRKRDFTAGYWYEIMPGTFTMHCTSLHVFANDMLKMRKEGPRK